MKGSLFFFIALFITGSACAQIPNAGFESWTAHSGYDTPDSIGNMNPYTSPGGYTCTEGSPGYSGAHYLQLQTQNCGTVVPGLAVTGNINVTGTSVTLSGGFPYTGRPASLAGAWQYMPFGSDRCHIIIYLSKWNTSSQRRDTVAFTDNPLGGMVMAWARFNINLFYYSSQAPDTGMIILSSSELPPATTATVGSYLFVDSLAFAGNAPVGVQALASPVAPAAVYPNPASGFATLSYYSVSGGETKVRITDITGRKTREIKALSCVGENNCPIDLTGVPPGMYIVTITDQQGRIGETKIFVE